MKKYFLKPYREENIKGWVLTLEDKVILFEKPKDSALKKSAYKIKESGGGSLTIMKNNGVFQEERTYPLWRDPRRTRG
jgi:hypothetical protein